MLAKKVLRDYNVNNVDIVRAHRLGPYKSGQTRPIIVKFNSYHDKQEILTRVYKGVMNNSGRWITEDFSVNTTKDRKYLQDHLQAAKNVLGKKIKSSSVRYKAIHIVSAVNGKKYIFSLNKVIRNSQTWWQGIQEKPESVSNNIIREPEIQSDITDVPEEELTQEPVDNDKEVVGDTVEQHSKSSAEGSTEEASNEEVTEVPIEEPSNENFEDAVEMPAASSATTDEALIP